MSAVVCKDTEVKCAPFPATPHHFNLKLLTKLENGNNIKYTFRSKDHRKLHKIRANCINTYFHTHSGFLLTEPSRFDDMPRMVVILIIKTLVSGLQFSSFDYCDSGIFPIRQLLS